MMLVDRDIQEAIDDGRIKIDPFDKSCLGTNSYDVHLGPTLLTYESKVLDVRKPPVAVATQIGPSGFTLLPGRLYLASTVEYTESHEHVPVLNGKSSLGRLGLAVHVTAGFGDVGFANHWTLELVVMGDRAVRVYAGIPIAQLCWFHVGRAPAVKYGDKQSAKYSARDSQPGASAMWRNF